MMHATALISQTSKRGFDTTYTYDFAGRNVLATRPDTSTNAVLPGETVGLVDPRQWPGHPGQSRNRCAPRRMLFRP